jgi:hypothetical protein
MTRVTLNFVGGTILSKQNFDSRFFQVLDNGNSLDPNLNIPNVANAKIQMTLSIILQIYMLECVIE